MSMSRTLDALKARRDARGDDGFTLIELLVVVVIIGVLIAIAIPVYLNYQKGSHDKAAQSDLRSAITTIEQCNSDNGDFPQNYQRTDGNQTDVGMCNNGTVKLSNGTVFRYQYNGSQNGGSASYMALTEAKQGSGKVYCYDSAQGGSVRDVRGDGNIDAGNC